MLRQCLAAAIAALALLAPPAASAQGTSSDTYRQLNLFGDVFERIRADYVEEVSDEQLIEAAIDGMLVSLDPHSSYLSAKNFEDMEIQTKGEFGGLGIEVTMENGIIKVVSPIDDTPAFRAGIQPGDLVTHIDGKPVLGTSLNDAVEKMRGPVQSEVTLTVRRGDKEPFDVKLVRDVIRIQSVRGRLEGDVGYVRITSFNEQTDMGLESAIGKLRADAKGKLVGYVLDLRNNPGGLLNQAIAVSDAFLERGEIVSTRGRKPEEGQRYNAKPGDLTDGLPVVVLINGGSASASEIVAGALQDHRRAVLLGTKTFGKGSVQTIIPIPGQGAIRLTTARYYTPSGRSIQATGIVPDIDVAPARIETIEAGDGTEEADLPGALQNEDAEPSEPSEPSATEAPAPTPEEPSEEGAAVPAQQDYQLARAVDLLRGLALFRAQAVN
jgi:carboxyl-terminal processing protease